MDSLLRSGRFPLGISSFLDPEQGGEHWNFTRTLETGDDGVCTVKEIQQVTIYDGINRFLLDRNHVICEFDEQHSKETGTKKIEITYDISEKEWEKLVEKAKLVFSGESYFEIKQ
jgi:allantoicase